MKKESKVLILVALLLANTAGSLQAQEDLGDEDLQTLLDESGSTEEVKEVSETVAPEATEPTAVDSAAIDTTTPTPTQTPSESVSSETVDLDALEPSEPTTETATNDLGTTPGAETLEELPTETTETVENTVIEKTDDDLEALTKDMGEPTPAVETVKKEEPVPTIPEPSTVTADKKPAEPEIFDVGREERDLLGLAQNIQGQISDTEWNEVATAAKVDSYTVVKDDWLFKISKRLFGSGFYYPKIWSLNSYITNPHFIEPGMVLSFTTGSSSVAPDVKLGTFTSDELNAAPGAKGTQNATDLANFGEDVKPGWLDEKNELQNQGVYFQYASEETMDDLTQAGEQALNREYENYEPPRDEIDLILPKNYDRTGFDKNSRIFYSVKEGFYLSTFVSTNIVQDFGSITNGPDENIFFVRGDRAYVQFDETVNALPGDMFSIYSSGGKVKHKNSDREGYKYSIVGQIKLIRKIKDKWEVEFVEVSGTPQRGDRITAYTPKIDRITKTYNSRLVEAAILAPYQPMQTILGMGDVIYLDRGRADGVEMGNVFEVYGFKDRLTDKNITDQPTYKLGELAVITLTDNFATALVVNSIRDFYAGDIAITKTKESHLREIKARGQKSRADKELMGGKALEELDVELNLENLNDDLLKQADKIQLTEDELAELERQEREKSVIKDSEKDLKALERLENEIEEAETILNDAKLDEDKLLENENLNDIEKKRGNIDQDSLEEIEENLGKRYLDEDLNSKDNPFGLTEFDVEEVDELLNVEKKEQQ
ncbi:LysM peptidoglycan-binding domain-containing protein [Peredibacter sp. HCB2-198]|uniref:LysM peptidoglycan-binding domain-containing protein n=1 Tax=Peredibacter sp. HCB2-198 TaxID=3383025 RepID=UPI0038B5671D